jgi:heme-degrading monooxygenase HmoA
MAKDIRMRHDTTSSGSLLAGKQAQCGDRCLHPGVIRAFQFALKQARAMAINWSSVALLLKGADLMYIAMNRFKVAPGSETAFEDLWTSRDTHLKEVPGFVEFHLLKGPQKEDHVLYSSHTIWSNYEAFEGWTHSDAFRAAHRNAGNETRSLYLGHPEFEGFEVIQTVK